jgi:hypothetical protein
MVECGFYTAPFEEGWKDFNTFGMLKKIINKQRVVKSFG